MAGKKKSYKYEVYCKKEPVGKFLYEHDRDVFLTAIEKEHPDCKFTVSNGK